MQAKVAYIEKGQTHTERDRQCNREQSGYNMSDRGDEETKG